MNHVSDEAMEHIIDDTRPIFVQIAERIEEDILAGRLAEEEQVPSTNQFAALYQINPATAAKGVNLLVDQGILYKKRGLGMYVATGARAGLLEKRREAVLRAVRRGDAPGGGEAGHHGGAGDAR